MVAQWLTLLAVVAVTGGNLLVRGAWLRLRSGQAGGPLFSPGVLIIMLQSWRFVLGMGLLVSGMIGWSIGISIWGLGWSALAFGLSYVVTVLCAWWFIGETLTLEKLCGTIIIVIGLLLIVHASGF